MGFKTCFPAILAVLWLIAGGTASAQNGSGFNPANKHYLWPTDASDYLSSTFGETRSSHFHAALDIKTWGREGYRVFATRDGTLHRIAIGPRGYGKVVYLKHEDGSYSVYAHLLSFSDPIQHLADSLRMREYSFELDRTLDSLAIPVKQGEVVGYSGATGIGPPHLHFELRNPNNEPFNPLLTNLSVPDEIPPQFSALSVEPLSINTEIEGGNRILTRRAYPNEGTYRFGTVELSGPAGLGVNVFDQANRVSNAYAVYRLELFVDGEKVFESTINSFSYLETGQMFLDRVYPLLQQSGEGYQRLYKADGNTLPFYELSSNGGRLHLAEGTHHVRITASDYFGNRSEAELTLEVSPPSGENITGAFFMENRVDPRNGLPNAPREWHWNANWISMSNRSAKNMILVPREIPGNEYIGLSRDQSQSIGIDLGAAPSYFLKTGPNDYFELRRLVPGRFHILKALREPAYALFGEHAFYDTLSAGLQARRFAPDSIRIDLLPANQPLQQEYTLIYQLDSLQSGKDRWGVYRYNRRKDKLEYLSTKRKEGYLQGEAEFMGTHYILRDTAAPRLSDPRLVKREDGKWTVTLTLTDNLSEIDHKRSTIYVNGIRGIPEHEPEDDRLVYYHPKFQPREVNRIDITVYDNMGNKTERIFYMNNE